MKPILIAALTGAALSLAACDPMMNDPNSASAAAAGDMTPETAMPYVAMAGASDLFEIESGRMAQQRGASSHVRDMGGMLIRDHMQTTAATMAAARASGMNPPPPRLMPMQAQMLSQLRNARGAEFDRLFARQQVQAHQMALALHQNYAANGDRPALRTSAASAVPVVQRHLDHARRMSGM